MADHHHLLLAACATAVLAAPVVAARPVHHHAPAPLPERTTVTVHHGSDAGPRYAEGDAPWRGGDAGDAPIGYRESNYGREDDAALFAGRYGCARPIWNAKSNRYIAACN